MNYRLETLKSITNGKIIGNKDDQINNLIFDSRMVIPPGECLFFAIKGEYEDGHNYMRNLYEKGIKNFVVNNYFKEFSEFDEANFLQVENTISALQQIAEYHRKQFSTKVIGITGSNGKTIVKQWLTTILNNYQPTLQSPKSYNSQIGVPLAVWELNKNYKTAVFEAGISKIGEMEKLQKIIKPTIGIFTNIGDAHQENFETIEQKFAEKCKLFPKTETIICCADNKYFNKYCSNNQLFTWSFTQKANVMAKIISKIEKNTLIQIKYKQKKYQITVPFSDKASIENILTVLTTLLYFFPNKNPKSFNFSILTSIEMRLEQVQGKNKCTIINDTYNSDLTSLRIAIDVLNTQKQNRKKTLILSDIFQVGKNEKEIYTKLTEIINKSAISKFIGIGTTIAKYSRLFTAEKYFFATTKEFIDNFTSINFYNETILIKGARKFYFEKISDKLQLKTHRTVLEINMKALENNFNHFREIIKPYTKIMVMVKAFSYGSGSFEIANFLQRKKADYLAVAITDEGIELRKAGIELPILILNPDTTNFGVLVEYNLEPEIYSFKMLEDFYKAIKNKVYQPYPIHIKLNTGMNRLGFCENQIDELIEKLQKYRRIYVKSIFSHLAVSDNRRYDDFTQIQIKLFKHISRKLEHLLGYKLIKHILNSAGIERFPKAQFDMVRLGIGLYGISIKNETKLQNISTLKTRVIQLTNVKAGKTIGYGGKAKVAKDSLIATIPIGYADGFNRLLSNGVGKVYINGKFYPVIGNICMDLSMIDVTGANISEGDEVEIFGEHYSISLMAKKLNTIAYEVLTSISGRVKRVYMWE